MAHDVFISYSSNDRNAALAVLHGLERTGIRCWMAPRDIKPGAIWAQAIMEGIEGGDPLSPSGESTPRSKRPARS